MPARASFQDDQYMAFEPQHHSPQAHEVFDLNETSCSSKHVVESDPGFLSPPMVEPIGKRESKKSQWLQYPWTLGKKKKQPKMDLSTLPDKTSTMVNVEDLFNTNRLPKECTLRLLPVWKPGHEFWARLLGKYDSGYYENTHCGGINMLINNLLIKMELIMVPQHNYEFINSTTTNPPKHPTKFLTTVPQEIQPQFTTTPTRLTTTFPHVFGVEISRFERDTPDNESFDGSKVKDDVEVPLKSGIPLHDDNDEGTKQSVHEGCEWRLMAAVVEKGHAMLQVRDFTMFTRVQNQIQANTVMPHSSLGTYMKEELRDCKRDYRPHDIINDIGQRMNIGISNNQAFARFQKAYVVADNGWCPLKGTMWAQWKEQHPLTLWAQAKIEKRIHKSANWGVYGISEIEFEVHEAYKTEKVHLRERTCTCMQWQLSGIPCGHLIAAIRSLNHTDCYQWASSCFTSDAYRRTWGYQVNPLPSPSEYELPPERMTVFPPSKEHRNSGRPRDRDRIPSRDEEPIVKRCSRCAQRGHFRNKCPEPMPAPSSLPGSSSRRNRSQSRTTYENENQQEDVFGTYNLGD
ncbi:hypothetical protein OSB04_004836 [Centaurea solstitialis]|uniref:SWIM-type domain-containing protein n=1 Tax=Centaurea solstitialis TaxID=347529 RepID=A0AA38TQF1_9ASTR|nr:hypothetical protein OSB04_004836 [Centaurea solstitialis]